MKRIILGVFDNPQFRDKVHNEGYSAYPFNEVLGEEFNWAKFNVIQNVQIACYEANEILFLLDYIEHSIVCQGFTSVELLFILSTPEILNKTIFQINGKNVEKDMVMVQYGRR